MYRRRPSRPLIFLLIDLKFRLIIQRWCRMDLEQVSFPLCPLHKWTVICKPVTTSGYLSNCIRGMVAWSTHPVSMPVKPGKGTKLTEVTINDYTTPWKPPAYQKMSYCRTYRSAELHDLRWTNCVLAMDCTQKSAELIEDSERMQPFHRFNYAWRKNYLILFTRHQGIAENFVNKTMAI
jgi:hypothetical protein